MDDSGQRENGRHKADQYKSMHTQWMMPQHQMKDSYTLKFMAIMSERDKAIHERNLALSEKKAALAERDMAMLQRDAAISERNTAIMERDKAIAALEYTRENGMNGISVPGCLPGCPAANVTKHIHHHHHQQHHYHQHLEQSPHLSDALYNHTRDVHTSEAFLSSPVSDGVGKGRKAKRKKETEVQCNQSKKKTKSPRKSRKGGADVSNEEVKTTKSEVEGGNDLNKQASAMEQHEWKSQDLVLKQVAFDETTMPAPVCSCTGKYQQCYKWGNGGWQSACCTMTLSMHPLPVMPNKRHARMGGRKMSGSVFNKLLGRLAAEGHDMSAPLDLKDHWAKHGTNRYITIR